MAHLKMGSRLARLRARAARLLTGWRATDRPATMISRRRVLRDLRPALANGDIRLCYQPKLCLRTGTVCGIEALLRWEHRRLGDIPPGVVIPLLETSSRLFDLTAWVLARAIADQARLREFGHDLVVHINVSSALLLDARFTSLVKQVAAQANGRIGFEITETAFIMDHERAAANIADFVALGFAVSIDDYGSGLSSLSYLKEFPASELKIDQRFVSSLTNCHRNPLIVRSTIDLAHGLGMTVVAEGVESLATLALLRAMGCDVIQGYIVSRALPIDELRVFIEHGQYRQLLTDAVVTIAASKAFWSRGGAAPEPRPTPATAGRA